MTEVFQFALLGLGVGAIYALLGQGLVLIYRGSGILNLAHGAFAMAGAYFYYELHSVHGNGVAVSLLATVAAGAVVGVATDQLLLRRMRQASPLARLIGTMGVLLVIQSVGILRYGSTALVTEPLFMPEPVEILGATVSSDRLWLLAIAVAMTAVLTFVLRYTRAGWVISAVSENPRGAAALGWSPHLVSAATWGVGAGLAALAGILISPITQLSVTTLTLTVISALAAALIGGFRSFPLTLAAGLAIGVGESEVGRYVDITGASSALPFLVIVAVLLLRGSSLPLRGEITDRLPAVGMGRMNLAVAGPAFGVTTVLVGLLLDDGWLAAAIVCLSVATILLSLVVVCGYAGQLSLAQYALAGIGTLVAARLVQAQGWPFEAALVVGVAAAVVVGLLVALPALRTRGVDLAVVTLGLGVAAQQLVFNNADLTGGASGTAVGSPSLFGVDVDAVRHPERYALLTLALFSLCAIVVANLRRGRSGRRLLAVRANERAAAALGVSVPAAKLHAFAVAGAIAGLGGIMLSFQVSTVVYDGFGAVDSITAVAQAVVGGLGFVLGPVAGATIAPGSVVEHITGIGGESAAKYLPLIGGIGLLQLLLLDPNGAVSAALRVVRRLPLERRDDPTRVPEARSVVRVAPKRLQVERLSVRYGGVVAVDDVSFEVAPAEVLALIGPNGAGKTSVIDGVAGFTPTTGGIVLDGHAIERWSPHRRARAGITRSFQSLELFEEMTVLENLQAAGDRRDVAATVTDLVRPGRGELTPAALAAVQEFDLGPVLDRRPPDLPYGQRRLVAIARAVAAQASVLLLDEPAAGLDEHESREFAGLVRRLADDWGIAVLVVEHDMEFVMGISDRVLVLDFGKPIALGTPDEVRADQAAIAAYLGRPPEPAEVTS